MWNDVDVAKDALTKPGRKITKETARLKKGVTVNKKNLAAADATVSKPKYVLSKNKKYIGGNHTVTSVDMKAAKKNIRGKSKVKNVLQQIDDGTAIYDAKTSRYLLEDGTIGSLYPNEAKFIKQQKVIPVKK